MNISEHPGVFFYLFLFIFIYIGKRAQSCFHNLKKKYMRKKKDYKEANRSGTSTKALEKTEKALDQYTFINWMDGFIQPRDGRTNIKCTTDTDDTIENEEPVISQDQDKDEDEYQRDQTPLQRKER